MLIIVEQHTRVQALSDFFLIPLFSEESDPVKITRQDHHKSPSCCLWAVCHCVPLDVMHVYLVACVGEKTDVC
jgi:hypothetical protein